LFFPYPTSISSSEDHSQNPLPCYQSYHRSKSDRPSVEVGCVLDQERVQCVQLKQSITLGPRNNHIGSSKVNQKSVEGKEEAA
jgi:hypothetical protein